MIVLQQFRDGVLHQENAGSVEFEETFDLIVAGLGSAGSAAAITAARRGLRVLGLERLPAMGGAGTLGGIISYYYGSSGGIYEELDREIRLRSEADYVPVTGMHPDCARILLQEEFEKAGGTLRLNALITGVYLDGKTLCGVQWLHEGKLHRTAAGMVLDCTAEAEVCVLCGCAFQVGRESDGGCQPFSMPMLTLYKGTLFCQFVDSGYLNAPSPEEMTQAQMEAMTGPMYLRDPFDPVDRVVGYSPVLGIREGRRITGEETVRLSDYLADRFPEKPLFYAYANLDKHGSDYSMESMELREWTCICGMWGVNLSIPIPLGALIPAGYRGLLAAGRHLSVDHDMASAVRMRRDMQKCGEAAAVAAEEIIRAGGDYKKADLDRIRGELLKTGCLESNPIRMKRQISRDDSLNPEIRWLSEPEEIREGLASENPGLALLSCRRAGEAGAALLRRLAESGESRLRKNCVIGMGLFRMPEAIPELRNLALSEKEERMQISAVCLLGELGGEAEVPVLQELLPRCGDGVRPYVQAAVLSIKQRIKKKEGEGNEMVSEPFD